MCILLISFISCLIAPKGLKRTLMLQLRQYYLFTDKEKIKLKEEDLLLF